MKTLKKDLFTIALVFSMILGTAFSFIPLDSNAYIQGSGTGEGDVITCWSSGEGYFGEYVRLFNLQLERW